MEKRTIIAIILTFLVIMLWGTIQSKFFPTTPTKEIKKEEVAPAEKVVEKKIEIKETTQPQKEAKLPSKIVPKKEVSVETQNYWAVFTSDDARLKHFKLKKYEDRVEETAMTVKLVQFFQDLFSKKTEPKKGSTFNSRLKQRLNHKTQKLRVE